MKILRYADLVPVPWKNGGGVTREIARQEQDGEFAWRLSIADVASEGAFSPFPGLRRILTVIDGPGMLLDRLNLEAHAANLFEPVAFSGDEPINGLLPHGPCRDFNVIWNPAFASASVNVVDWRSTTVTDSKEGVIGILCLTGLVDLSSGQTLAPFDFALLDATTDAANPHENSTALLVHIRPVSKP